VEVSVARSVSSILLAAALAAVACNKSDKAPANKDTHAPAPAPAPGGGGGGDKPAAPVAPAAAPDGGAASKLEARPGGPSVETCEKFADHTGTFVADSMLPPGATDAQKKYVANVVKQDHGNRLAFCLGALEQKEIDCVLNAVDFPALAECERFRRQVPPDLVNHKEVTQDDCDRFYLRYKQFMMNDGVPSERVEKDKDQITRACMDKAKPGTVACFITAETYEEAKRCP
jgi:hypothetical protein